MHDELLIQLVRNHPVLFDTSHEKYMDSGLKQRIWAKIAVEGKTDVAGCKARWNNIRDNYRKSWKKSEGLGTPGGVKRTKKYKYSEQLQFLNPYFDIRDSVRAADEQEDATNDTNEHNDYEEQEIQIDISEGFTLQPIQTIQPMLPICSVVEDTGCNVDFGNERPMKSPIRRAQKRRFPAKESPSATIMKYLIDKNQRASDAVINPVDAFLSGIAPSLRSLSAYDWHLAKSELFSVVQKYELKSIMQTDRMPHSATPHSSNSPAPSGSDGRNLDTRLPREQHSTDTSMSAQEDDPLADHGSGLATYF